MNNAIDHRSYKRPTNEKPAPALPLHNVPTVYDDVLIWCPIATAGLTTQLEQITEVLRSLGVTYKISYHHPPAIEHHEILHWIEPDQIRNPRVVFFMERYVPFEVGFLDSYHIYYVNLDWLSPKSISVARVYADLVIAPTTHRFEEICDLFPNSKVVLQPWPAASSIEVKRRDIAEDDVPIRVLYVGNEYDEKSRKSPKQVVDAILSCERHDIRFDLKFRSKLPKDVYEELDASPIVDQIIDHPISGRRMESLYRKADVNLAPNCSEGNGLSILESFAKGVVPAVLDGHPMKDVVSAENGYFISCKQVGEKELAPLYETTSEAIGRFILDLDHHGIARRQEAIIRKQEELVQRQVELEEMIGSVLAMNGLIAPPDHLGDGTHETDERQRPVALTSWYERYTKPTRLIDIVMTTSRRHGHFRQSLAALAAAMDASPYDHRLSVFVDGVDPDTDAILDEYRNHISQCFWTSEPNGLPYAWNTLLDTTANLAARTERTPEFICYLQDDALITEPGSYFSAMVGVAQSIEPGKLGFVSGFYTEVHPGYLEMELDGRKIVLSDSIDGKNFMARPKTIYSIGKLTWWFPDGTRRGNPGPLRGSHFDLWQWKESPRCLLEQGRVSVIVPGLIIHSAETADESTWNNDTSSTAVRQRVADDKTYRTR